MNIRKVIKRIYCILLNPFFFLSLKLFRCWLVLFLQYLLSNLLCFFTNQSNRRICFYTTKLYATISNLHFQPRFHYWRIVVCCAIAFIYSMLCIICMHHHRHCTKNFHLAHVCYTYIGYSYVMYNTHLCIKYSIYL